MDQALYKDVPRQPAKYSTSGPGEHLSHFFCTEAWDTRRVLHELHGCFTSQMVVARSLYKNDRVIVYSLKQYENNLIN